MTTVDTSPAVENLPAHKPTKWGEVDVMFTPEGDIVINFGGTATEGAEAFIHGIIRISAKEGKTLPSTTTFMEIIDNCIADSGYYAGCYAQQNVIDLLNRPNEIYEIDCESLQQQLGDKMEA